MDLRQAKEHIDRVFGEGTSDEKPELVIQYLQYDAILTVSAKLQGIFDKMNAGNSGDIPEDNRQ